MGDRFVSTKELEEIRKRRQEEWEKVRKPEDPIGKLPVLTGLSFQSLWDLSISISSEAPEEQIDHRSLYERLKEVRDKKQAEWEEEHKFSNNIFFQFSILKIIFTRYLTYFLALFRHSEKFIGKKCFYDMFLYTCFFILQGYLTWFFCFEDEHQTLIWIFFFFFFLVTTELFAENMIRGLDTEESDFLSKVDSLRAEQDRKKKEVMTCLTTC